MKIVTVEQMQALEFAAAEAGVSTVNLMEKAGVEVAGQAIQSLATPRGARVLILVGPGNNGGDGLVAARYLHQWGARVQVYLCAPRNQPDPNLALVEDRGIPIIITADDTNLSQLRQQLDSASLIIDAVLGTGKARPIARPLDGKLKDILLEVAATRQTSDKTVLAVDLPTGLNADTGEVDPACPGADITVALGLPKLGHYTFPGASVTGHLEIVDIGLPADLDRDVSLELLTPDQIQRLLPTRPLEAHKGTFGRLLVVAGSRSFVGATVLACGGAYRAGAGLVTLATPVSVYPIAAAALAEATHLPLPETEDGAISSEATMPVRESMPQYAAAAIGCGLGQDAQTRQFLQELLLEGSIDPTQPMVIDADALNALAQIPAWHQALKSSAVLTPHPGEMSRLYGMTTDQVQERRLELARQAAQEWGQVVVLKGAFTIVAAPDGTTRISPFANPGLASGGTGDVLTGIIGGLLTQGLSPLDAASCGVYIHAAAAEELRHSIGDAGLMATDLLPEIPHQIMALKASR